MNKKFLYKSMKFLMAIAFLFSGEVTLAKVGDREIKRWKSREGITNCLAQLNKNGWPLTCASYRIEGLTYWKLCSTAHTPVCNKDTTQYLEKGFASTTKIANLACFAAEDEFNKKYAITEELPACITNSYMSAGVPNCYWCYRDNTTGDEVLAVGEGYCTGAYVKANTSGKRCGRGVSFLN